MKIPSRKMPPYVPQKISGIIWCMLICIFTVALFQFYTYPWLLSIVPILLILLKILPEDKSYENAIVTLAKSRAGEDIGTFAKHFNCRDIDTWVIRAVYEQFQNYLNDISPNFPLHPEDKVYELLVEDPDDFEMDLIKEISQRTGRSLKKIEKNPYAQKLETIQDVLLMFNTQPLTENNLNC